MFSDTRSLRITVIQTESRSGDIQGNLEQANLFIKQAADQGTQMIVFPELMPTGYELSTNIWKCGEKLMGPTCQWLLKTSAHYGIWMGTSFLEVSGAHFYNTFMLSTPEGKIAGTVRKEFPASMEGFFFKGEQNPHIIPTALGNIAVGICYENYLSSIANKIVQGNPDLLLMPFSFPRIPGGDIQPLSGDTYSSFYSKKLGIPAVAVNKVGAWESPIPTMKGITVTGAFPGQSAISDANGTVKVSLDDREGFGSAEVVLDSKLKKTDVHFSGKYVEELANKTGDVRDQSKDESSVEELASQFYRESEERVKAAHILSQTNHN